MGDLRVAVPITEACAPLWPDLCREEVPLFVIAEHGIAVPATPLRVDVTQPCLAVDRLGV